jgi:hypothetical protein
MKYGFITGTLLISAALLWPMQQSEAFLFGRNTTMQVNTELIKLPYRIVSNPALYSQDGRWRIALVGAVMDEESDKFSIYEERQLNGDPVQGVEPQRHPLDAAETPPAQQLGTWTSGGSNALLRVQSNGQLISSTSTLRPTAPNSQRAVLIWPPTTLSTPPHPVVLLSRDMRPKMDVLNQIDILSAQGVSLPGFPQALGVQPAEHPPVHDQDGQRLFILLSDGHIDGFDLLKAKRLAGFPSLTPQAPGVYRKLAYERQQQQLLVVDGTEAVWKINPQNAKASRVTLEGAKRLKGIATHQGLVYLYDQGSQRLRVFNTANQLQSEHRLSDRDVHQDFHAMDLFPLGHGELLIFLLTAHQTDHWARVEHMWQLYGTEEEDKKNKQIMTEFITERFSGKPIPPDKQKELNQDMLEFKQESLRRILGESKYQALYHQKRQSKITVLSLKNKQFTEIENKEIAHYGPETGAGYTNHVFPTLLRTAKQQLVYLVPLNYAGDEDALNIKMSSRLWLHTLQLPEGN